MELQKESKEIIVGEYRYQVVYRHQYACSWLMRDSGVLDLLIKKYAIPKDFRDIYLNRHKHSIDFIERIIDLKSRGFPDEFYFSYLAMNEVYSASGMKYGVSCFLKMEHPSHGGMKRKIPSIFPRIPWRPCM